MSSNNNNGLFNKVKKTMAKNQAKSSLVGQNLATKFAPLEPPIARRNLSQDFAQQFAVKEQILNSAIDLELRQTSIDSLREHEQRLKQLFDMEKEKYEKNSAAELKHSTEHYERLIAEREREAKQEISKLIAEYEFKLKKVNLLKEQEFQEQLQQELIKQQNIIKEKQQAMIDAAVAGNTYKLRSELDAERMALEQQAHDLLLAQDQVAKFKTELEQSQTDMHAHIMQIKQQAENKLNIEYSAKLEEQKSQCEAIIAQFKTDLLRAEQTKTQYESRFEARLALLQQEHAQTVAQLNSAHEAKHEAKLEEFKAQQEIAVAQHNAKLEEFKVQQEIALAQHKAELTQLSDQALQEKIVEETQRILAATEQEKLIVIKYKEKELRDDLAAELVKAKEQLIQDNAEILSKALEEQQREVDESLADQIQEAVVQERALQAQKYAAEKKLLLQQQQNILLEQYNIDLKSKLNSLTQELQAAHKEEQTALKLAHQAAQTELKLAHKAAQTELQAAHKAEQQELRRTLEHEYQQKLNQFTVGPLRDAEVLAAAKEQELRAVLELELADKLQQVTNKFAQEKQQELLKQENILRDNFDTELDRCLREARAEWQQAQAQALQFQSQAVHVQLEQQIRKEFQEILAEQRTQDLELLQKQKEQEVHAAIEAYKSRAAQEFLQERKKLNLKLNQEKAIMHKKLSNQFEEEKQEAIAQFEVELRDTLYKEMVRQKDYVQSKFAKNQEAALQEQKRRLEAEHKQEVERIKQGYFTVKDHNEFATAMVNNRIRHNPTAERGIEHLADRILAKFQGHKED